MKSLPDARRSHRKLLTALSILMAVTLACNLPFIPTPAPKLEDATTTPQTKTIQTESLPPVVIETLPLPSGMLPLSGVVTLNFDQAMDQESVEGALKVEPALPGRFEWTSGSSVSFVPDQPLPPETEVTITVADTAKSSEGLNLLRAASFNFQTPGALRVTEILPKPGVSDANPSSTVAVSFNQPVAALGDADSPQAFTLDPQVDGSGTWLNTSTYVFQADPALGGGVQYRVRLNPELTSLAGAALDPQDALDWEFTTTPPALLTLEPRGATTILLDAGFTLTFNQPMDAASVESNFTFADAVGTIVPGTFTWSNNNSIAAFKPSEPLKRGNSYFLQLSNLARSAGGTELPISTRVQYQTIGEFAVASTEPAAGNSLSTYTGFGTVIINFNAPLAEGQDLSQLVRFEPEPGNLTIQPTQERQGLYLSGSFLEGITYRLTLSADLKDRWDSPLGIPYTSNIRVAASEPTLQIPMLSASSRTLFSVPGDAVLPAFAVNLSSLSLARKTLNLQEFLDTFFYTLDVDAFNDLEQWDQALSLPPNTSQGVEIDLTPGEDALASGFYVYRVDSPELSARNTVINFALVVSPLQVTIKESAEEVFIWVTDLRTGLPVSNLSVVVYTTNLKPWSEGTTGDDGVVRLAVDKDREYYPGMVVVAGTPENGYFGVGATNWSDGISPWQLGIPASVVQPELKAYIYTDRPIYRPGQTIHFRAILRAMGDARYQPTVLENVELKLIGEYNIDTGQPTIIDTVNLSVSPYGTVNGAFKLADDVPPGNYTIQLSDSDAWLNLQVAEYRKPEIDVQVVFSAAEYRGGQDLQAQISAEYYFGGAVDGVEVRWSLYAQDDFFNIPGGFTTGKVDTRWLYPSGYGMPDFGFGTYLTGATGTTASDGSLSLTFSSANLAEVLDLSVPHTLILQAEVVDESGQTVSKRGSTQLHPDDFYIGLQPESWLVQAGETLGFTVQTSDWRAAPLGGKELTAVFQRVEWVQDWSNVQTGAVTFREQLTEIGSVNLQTDANGLARIEFGIEAAGSYRLDVRGGQALSQVMVWAGGASAVPWPNLPDQHIRLQSGQESYKPGETARVFIPNPFPQGALALVTIERRGVLRSQVSEIQGSSATIDLEILPEDAPNVYVSAVLISQSQTAGPDFRIGYLELKVDAQALLLGVQLTAAESTLAPGQTARFDVQVLDSAGKPVQGEFSIAVVDKAIFALADPNAEDIVSTFYGTQLLGVLTSSTLAAYTGRITTIEPGMGGGGGGGDQAQVPTLRTDFRDTAYWSGAFETDANGRAVIEFPLPDNLTTWTTLVRGLTQDTKVGEAVAELLVTKDLIVRPVTPRFLVAGDRVQLGAVVNNNTSRSLDVTVDLQSSGITLEDPAASSQSIQVAPGGRERVNWWATVPDAGSANLVFSARSGGLQDSATPALGEIPILHYVSPQTFATSGLITSEGENLEVVNLPRSYTPTGGELRVELSSTLAGAVLSGLETLDSYPFDLTEPVISHLLANLATFNLARESGAGGPDLAEKLQKAIREDLARLPRLQNGDGGFGWSHSSKSDLYLTSYALLAMVQAEAAGFIVPAGIEQAARRSVAAGMLPVRDTLEDWQLDRLALAHYALNVGHDSSLDPVELYPQRERLSPWAKALLALTLINRGDTDSAKTLLSDLGGLAIRSATGVNWQDSKAAWQNFSTPNFTTAVVVLALADADPASPLLADAVRYLTAHRRANGGWFSSYDSAWVLTALTRYLHATAELSGDFEFSAILNDAPIASGIASGNNWNVVRASAPISEMAPDRGNALRFTHGEGGGRLYYRAYLEVGQPVELAEAIDRGLTVSRDYILAGADCAPQDCPPVDSISLDADTPVIIGRVTVTNPTDQYYVVVKDAIPAGAEVINLKLNTAPLVQEGSSDLPVDVLDPYADGWGWWWFDEPAITDDGIQWIASYLPAGTYTLTYKLQPLLAGEFRVLPARAYDYYFPEVEGRSAGTIFTIEE